MLKLGASISHLKIYQLPIIRIYKNSSIKDGYLEIRSLCGSNDDFIATSCQGGNDRGSRRVYVHTTIFFRERNSHSSIEIDSRRPTMVCV